MRFETGRVVKLRSGSPPLTVFEARTDGLIAVEWFKGGEIMRDVFPPAMLKPAWWPRG